MLEYLSGRGTSRRACKVCYRGSNDCSPRPDAQDCHPGFTTPGRRATEAIPCGRRSLAIADASRLYEVIATPGRAFMTLTVISSLHYRLAGDVKMAKASEDHVKEKVEKGIGEAANGLRKKGREIQEYLKQVRAEGEEGKFGGEGANE